MSFALTTEQIRQRQKTVTRRVGWEQAKPGDVVQPIVKGQGLKKGEHVEKIGGPIRFVAVDRVVLGDITSQDVYREGFPDMTPRQFVDMFKQHNGGLKDQVVTRIQFEYVEAMTDRDVIAAIRRTHLKANIAQFERDPETWGRPNWDDATVDPGGTIFGPGPYLHVPIVGGEWDGTRQRVYPPARLRRQLNRKG